MLKRLTRATDPQDLIEYALIGAIVSCSAMASVRVLGSSMTDLFDDVLTVVTNGGSRSGAGAGSGSGAAPAQEAERELGQGQELAPDRVPAAAGATTGAETDAGTSPIFRNSL